MKENINYAEGCWGGKACVCERGGIAGIPSEIKTRVRQACWLSTINPSMSSVWSSRFL